MIEKILKFLEDNKCENIYTFKNDKYIVDNVIIATVLGGNHAISIAEKMLFDLKQEDVNVITDGNAKDGWIVVEVLQWNVMVHLMTQQKRDFFNIEEFLENRFKK